MMQQRTPEAQQARREVPEADTDTNNTPSEKKGFWEILRDFIVGVSACIVAVVEAIHAICSLNILEINALFLAAG